MARLVETLNATIDTTQIHKVAAQLRDSNVHAATAALRKLDLSAVAKAAQWS
jgi:hypothetical protein